MLINTMFHNFYKFEYFYLRSYSLPQLIHKLWALHVTINSEPLSFPLGDLQWVNFIFPYLISNFQCSWKSDFRILCWIKGYSGNVSMVWVSDELLSFSILSFRAEIFCYNFDIFFPEKNKNSLIMARSYNKKVLAFFYNIFHMNS